jgi:hypothetical protein
MVEIDQIVVNRGGRLDTFRTKPPQTSFRMVAAWGASYQTWRQLLLKRPHVMPP